MLSFAETYESEDVEEEEGKAGIIGSDWTATTSTALTLSSMSMFFQSVSRTR
jgi:hypothetical protein